MLFENPNCLDLKNNKIEFSLLHLNIRSISKKLDSFSNFFVGKFFCLIFNHEHN